MSIEPNYKECISCQYPTNDYRICEGCKEAFCHAHAVEEFNEDGFCKECISDITSEARQLTEGEAWQGQNYSDHLHNEN